MDVDPTLVFLLVTVGLLGVGIEALTPGGIVPGLLGVAALVVGGIYAADGPVTAAGIGLLALAIALFIADASLAFARRAIALAGTVALALSGIFFFDRSEEPTSIPVAILVSVLFGAFMLFVIERAAGARSGPVRTGYEELVGGTAEVRSTLDPEGQVFIEGALWRARLAPGQEPARPGDRVAVESVDGLTLIVTRPAGAEAGTDNRTDPR